MAGILRKSGFALRVLLPVFPRKVPQIAQCRFMSLKLAEVGVLETPKLQEKEKYEIGQLFLHRVFGYRGIVVANWMGTVYDRDIELKSEDRSIDKEEGSLDVSRDGKQQGAKGKPHIYYLVLMDSRDYAFTTTEKETVTFLTEENGERSIYAIPGLDYVAHEDVLPYSTSEKQPIQHELFDKFLMFDPDNSPPFISRDSLRAWLGHHHPWLELTDVHRETTENVRVTVIPFYIGSFLDKKEGMKYMWRYHIRLENVGEEAVQLRERHWRIFSMSGTLETTRGKGVIGKEPLLTNHVRSFQYSSHVPLHSPSGHMWGTFKMMRLDGSVFDCRVPPFELSVPKKYTKSGDDPDSSSSSD